MGEVEVSLNNSVKSQISVTIPFLVTSENWEYHILGTNAVEHLSAPYKSDELQYIVLRCLPNHSSEVLHPLITCVLRIRPEGHREPRLSSSSGKKEKYIKITGT